MDSENLFKDLLNQYMSRIPITADGIANATKKLARVIPKQTIIGWTKGSIPVDSESVLATAKALGLAEHEVDTLLVAAKKPTLEVLRRIHSPNDVRPQLLAFWPAMQVHASNGSDTIMISNEISPAKTAHGPTASLHDSFAPIQQQSAKRHLSLTNVKPWLLPLWAGIVIFVVGIVIGTLSTQTQEITAVEKPSKDYLQASFRSAQDIQLMIDSQTPLQNVSLPFMIQAGDWVHVEYITGTWTTMKGDPASPYTDAEGYRDSITPWSLLKTAPVGSLVGIIGNNDFFKIGNAVTFQAKDTGSLSLQINDGNCVCLGDNDGAITVRVQVFPTN